jgi:hypothetical protein
MKLQDPVNYIRSEWIRPEDLHLYEDLGYDSFKITERGAPTPVLVRRVKAWSERRYDGNLLDLVQPFGFAESRGAEEGKGLRWKIRHFFRPLTVSLRRLWAVKRLAEERGLLGRRDGLPPVEIDNRALDGFMDRFLSKGCKDVDCEACRHCHRWAEKAVRIDPGYRERCLALYDEVFRDMHSGRMWGLGDGRAAPEAADRPASAAPAASSPVRC